MNEKFAVIDTETNWEDDVMSIGVVIAEDNTYNALEEYYGIITPACLIGGMYSCVLRDDDTEINTESTRDQILREIRAMLQKHGVRHLFAYNANFDKNHLPELSDYAWADIMQTTMYRQYNPFIPDNADLCRTGKLRRGYDVESVLHMVTGSHHYEVHNALCDARDELFIMSSFGMRIQRFIANSNKSSADRTRDYNNWLISGTTAAGDF